MVNSLHTHAMLLYPNDIWSLLEHLQGCRRKGNSLGTVGPSSFSDCSVRQGFLTVKPNLAFLEHSTSAAYSVRITIWTKSNFSWHDSPSYAWRKLTIAFPQISHNQLVLGTSIIPHKAQCPILAIASCPDSDGQSQLMPCKINTPGIVWLSHGKVVTPSLHSAQDIASHQANNRSQFWQPDHF